MEEKALRSSPWPQVPLVPGDRVLVMAPHPDDEVLGCSGIIQQAVKMGLPVRVIFFTNGDCNEWSFILYRRYPVVTPEGVKGMGRVRFKEALKAADTMKLSPDELVFLGYPDFGTLTMWYTHWGYRPPYEGILTRATRVPYEFSFRPGAPYKGEEVLKDIKVVLRDFKPTKVFISHPGDHHPDHQAFYLFTRTALWDLEEEMNPDIYCYLAHFKRWPTPRGYHPEKGLEPPPSYSDETWTVHDLASEENKVKFNALKQHLSQYEANSRLLVSFVRSNELFFEPFPVPVQATISILTRGREEYLTVIPERLTRVEKKVFVDVKEEMVQLVDDSLVITVRLSQPLSKEVELSVHAFGYRKDRPFAEMPKVHAQLGAITQDVYDQDRKLSEKLEVIRQSELITVKVPLVELGNPQKIFIGARTYIFDVPLDWVPWTSVVVPPL